MEYDDSERARELAERARAFVDCHGSAVRLERPTGSLGGRGE